MYGEQPVSASVLSQGKNKYTITFDGSQYEVTGKLAPRLDTNHIELVCDIQGDISKQLVLVNREGVTLYTRDGSYEFALPVPKFLSASAGAGGLGDAVAPMPGVIEKVTNIYFCHSPPPFLSLPPSWFLLSCLISFGT